jgi:hypothetical protein
MAGIPPKHFKPHPQAPLIAALRKTHDDLRSNRGKIHDKMGYEGEACALAIAEAFYILAANLEKE